MKFITIHKPDGVSTFQKGEKIIRDGKGTDITVVSINYWFGKVTVTLSDKSRLVYKGFPISYVE